MSLGVWAQLVSASFVLCFFGDVSRPQKSMILSLNQNSCMFLFCWDTSTCLGTNEEQRLVKLYPTKVPHMRDAPDQRIVSKNSDDTSAFPLRIEQREGQGNLWITSQDTSNIIKHQGTPYSNKKHLNVSYLSVLHCFATFLKVVGFNPYSTWQTCAYGCIKGPCHVFESCREIRRTAHSSKGLQSSHQHKDKTLCWGISQKDVYTLKLVMISWSDLRSYGLSRSCWVMAKA